MTCRQLCCPVCRGGLWEMQNPFVVLDHHGCWYKRNKEDKKKRFCVWSHTWLKNVWPLPFVLFLFYLTPGKSKSVPLRDWMKHISFHLEVPHLPFSTNPFIPPVYMRFHSIVSSKTNRGSDIHSRALNHACPGRAHTVDLCRCHIGVL